METKTVILPRASSMVSTWPKKSVKGPSVILTASPTEKADLNLGAACCMKRWMDSTSEGGRGVGLLPTPTKLVMPGVVRTQSQESSVRISLTSM